MQMEVSLNHQYCYSISCNSFFSATELQVPKSNLSARPTPRRLNCSPINRSSFTDYPLSFRQQMLSSCSRHHKPVSLNSRGSSMSSRMALGSNVSEDTDDMYDDLFKRYGKVVFRRNDQKPATAEVDDDAESLSFAVAVAKVASEVKAADIRVLFVKPLVYWTRFFIIATAFSRPQIDAIGSKVRDMAEKQYGKVASGDSKPNSWTLLDFGDVVVHIFLPQQREFYNLEEFYANATPIELPFENQHPFRG